MMLRPSFPTIFLVLIPNINQTFSRVAGGTVGQTHLRGREDDPAVFYFYILWVP